MSTHSYSQLGQDLFVLQCLKEKKNGIFVDIGCCEPIFLSNTYLLEKDHGWSGVALDIIEQNNRGDANLSWKNVRPNSKLVIQDALTVDYEKLFEQHKLPFVIDYLTLDLEPPKATFDCLKLIPFDKYKFRCITFETDSWRNDDGSTPETGSGIARRDESRLFLIEKGYIFVNEVNQDDYYIHADLMQS